MMRSLGIGTLVCIAWALGCRAPDTPVPAGNEPDPGPDVVAPAEGAEPSSPAPSDPNGETPESGATTPADAGSPVAIGSEGSDPASPDALVPPEDSTGRTGTDGGSGATDGGSATTVADVPDETATPAETVDDAAGIAPTAADAAVLGAPDAATPDAATPGAATPGAATPDAATPGAATPEAEATRVVRGPPPPGSRPLPALEAEITRTDDGTYRIRVDTRTPSPGWEICLHRRAADPASGGPWIEYDLLGVAPSTPAAGGAAESRTIAAPADLETGSTVIIHGTGGSLVPGVPTPPDEAEEP